MENKRLEWKVGLFMFIGLVLLAALLIQFSKGASLFRSTYELELHAGTVGGLKNRSGVLLAGVEVGAVSDIQLDPSGKSVIIRLKIYKENPVYADARFVIESANFLGDQYVAIVPGLNQGPVLADHAVVNCADPFNLQEVARNAAGFISRIDETAQRLNEAIADVRKLVLNEETLTNLAVTVGTLRTASEHALTVVNNVNTLVETNRASVSTTMSNLVYFSEQLNALSGKLGGMVDTNSAELNVTMKNLSASSADLKNLLDDAQAGRGLAGAVLKNAALAQDISTVAANLSVTTSNLNQQGLWRVLFPKKK